MQKGTNIDDVFKQKALNFGVKVPASMFDSIAGNLQKRKKKRKRRFLIFFISLFGAAIISLFMMFSNNRNLEQAKKFSKVNHKTFVKSNTNPKTKTIEKLTDNSFDKKQNTLESKNENHGNKTTTKVQEETNEGSKVEKINKSKIVKSPPNKTKVDANKTKDVEFVEEILEEKNTEIKTENESTTSPDNLDGVSEKTSKTKPDTVNLASDDLNDNANEEKSFVRTDSSAIDSLNIESITDSPPLDKLRRFTIGFTVGPGKSFRASEVGDIEKDFIAESSNDEAISNFNTNIYLKYQLSKRFSISTGLSFFKIGHAAKFSIPKEYLEYIFSENFGHTSAGFYDLDIDKVENMLKSNDFYAINCLKKFEDIKLNIDVTDIPLSLSFKLLEKKKLKLEFIGGLNLAFLRNSEIEIGLDGDYYSVGSMNDMRQTLYGFNLGLGLVYNIYHGFDLRIIPAYRRYFSTVSTSESFKYYPYQYSINAGFSFSF